MELLEQITATRTQIDRLRGEYSRVSKQFSTWLYWAIDQDWFSEWQYENAFKAKELKNPKRYDIEVPPEFFEQDTGQPLFGLKHLLYLEKDRALYDLQQLLIRAWKEEIPLADIAEAYGEKHSENPKTKYGTTTYNAIRKLPGFKVRNELLSLSVKKASNG